MEGNFEQWMDEFGIDQGGNFANHAGLQVDAHVHKTHRATPIEHDETLERGVIRHTKTVDFIQSIAGAREEELTTIMLISIDIMTRECHKDRPVNGFVDNLLKDMVSKWKRFCQACTRLNEWIENKNRLAKERMDNKDKEREEEEERIRRRTQAVKELEEFNCERFDASPSDSTRFESKGRRDPFPKSSAADPESRVQQRGDSSRSTKDVPSDWRSEYNKFRDKKTGEDTEEIQRQLLEVFGSELLADIQRTPEDLYRDTCDIRICTILCIVAKSKALQRLVCVGKFYAPSMGHEYQYVGIPKESLDEFLALTNILRNAFMTQQTSHSMFVKTIQNMVIRGGVHGFVTEIFNPGRHYETIRLSVSSVV